MLFGILFVSFSNKDHHENSVYKLWSFDNHVYASCDRGLLEIRSNGSDSLIIESRNDRVMSLFRNSGVLLAGTYNGIIHVYENGKSQKINLPQRENGTPYLVNAVVVKNGFWWASTLEGVVFQIDPIGPIIRQVTLMDRKTSIPKNTLGIAIDNNDNLWVLGVSGVHFIQERKRGRKRPFYFLASGNYNHTVMDLLSSPKGVFSFSNESGSLSLRLGTFTRTLMDASKNEVELPKEINPGDALKYCVSNGNLWLFSKGNLFQLSNRIWKPFDSGIDAGVEVESICIRGNELWVVSKHQVQSHKLIQRN